MHQDQRIGLALGVLLVGACAAFFFRNDSREISKVPRLHNARELDDRIAERSTRPYLNGIEAVEAADRNPLRTVADQRPRVVGPHDDRGASYWSPVESFNGNVSHEKSRGDGRHQAKPADSDSDVQELAPIPLPHDDRFVLDRSPANESHETPVGAGRVARKSDGAATEGRTHVVQKGETLSSIAAKMLGTASRFHEIFEANHDQLKDANDLKLGMTLRIPETRAEPASKSPTSNARPVVDVEIPVTEKSLMPVDPLQDAKPPLFEGHSLTPSNDLQESISILMPPELPTEPQHNVPIELPQNEQTSPIKKFVPARRLPPPSRPAGPQAKANGLRDVAGRKLSQVSSESRPGKIAR